MVDPQHFTHEFVAVGSRLESTDRQHPRHEGGRVDLGSEFGERHTVAEVGGSRSEHVAPVERRTPGTRHPVVGVGEFDGAGGAADEADRRREETVVGTDLDGHAVADLDRNRAPVGADPWVDHRHHDARAEVVGGAGERQTTGSRVVTRDPVAHVDHPDRRRDGSDHRMHDPDELVGMAVVGEKGDGVVTQADGVHVPTLSAEFARSGSGRLDDLADQADEVVGREDLQPGLGGAVG